MFKKILSLLLLGAVGLSTITTPLAAKTKTVKVSTTAKYTPTMYGSLMRDAYLEDLKIPSYSKVKNGLTISVNGWECLNDTNISQASNYEELKEQIMFEDLLREPKLLGITVTKGKAVIADGNVSIPVTYSKGRYFICPPKATYEYTYGNTTYNQKSESKDPVVETINEGLNEYFKNTMVENNVVYAIFPELYAKKTSKSANFFIKVNGEQESIKIKSAKAGSMICKGKKPKVKIKKSGSSVTWGKLKNIKSLEVIVTYEYKGKTFTGYLNV